MSSYNEQISTIDFSNPDDYTFNPGVIDVSSNSVELAITNNPDQEFNIDFANDTGFVYDSNLVEFVGGELRQKDKRPVNSIIGATYSNSIDASFSADSFVDGSAILNGIPSIINNKLSCIGSQGVKYSDDLIADLSGNWVAKFTYTPNYTTAPTTNVNIFAISQNSGGTDDVIIFNSPAGGSGIRITANGLSAVTFGAFIPAAGQDYIFEIFCISNVVTVFIDGVEVGTGKTINPSQGATSNSCHLGAYSTAYNIADGSFSDFILYSTAVQTIDYEVPESAYLESLTTTPGLEYTGVGALVEFDMFETVETNTPRYTIQVGISGDYLYWSGSAWGVSDGSYAQSTDAITFNNNSLLLDVEGEIYGQFKIHFETSNTQQSVSDLTATLTAQTYSKDNPTIEVDEVFYSDFIISLTSTESITGSDRVKAVIRIGNTWYYFLNGVLTETTGDVYDESNTIQEINQYIQGTVTERTRLKIKLFLHSEDGLTTPNISEIVFTYAFAASTEDSIDICTVYWYAKTIEGLVSENTTYVVKLGSLNPRYKNQTIVVEDQVSDTPDAEDGYVEFNLIPNTEMSYPQDDSLTPFYEIYNKINGKLTKICDILVPKENSSLLWDIVKIE